MFDLGRYSGTQDIIIELKKMKTYKSTGVVLGNVWGGGTGSYAARPLFANSKEQLTKQIKTTLADGTLDSGMGFESLIGALMTIEEIETILENKKEYQRSEFSEKYFGKLTIDDKSFLNETLLNS